jgi:superfamily II DNA or RNA helicase
MIRVFGGIGINDRLYSAGIVNHQYRNEVLATAAQWLMHTGKRVLVLVKEIGHAETLAKLIPGSVQVDGRDNTKVKPVLDDLEAGRIQCVIGTSVIGEGRDVPAADALVYAAGGKSKVKVVQDFFRVLTASEGKKHGIVIDAADIHHDKLEVSAAHRLAMYKRDFNTSVIDPGELPSWIKQVG